ncbi:toll/interleukin-1 receptor domain-containing protein [Nocardia sp. BMG111209]|uniref:toll/interleukin-1 receptor domain-containing protein n=1 Tax=Nocardia sp. BMG111209 TaxID=1160137 RepID=UPI00039DDD96|nr:toll/interleukin-1 receptor domain-containing protein [Nocardia sp. BMG111209]
MRIFISHAGTDVAAALALKQWLVRQRPELAGGIVLDTEVAGIRAGKHWRDAMRAAVTDADAVICLISPRWLRSAECRAEFRTAEVLGKRILCAGIEPAEDDTMREWQRFELFGPGPSVAIAARPYPDPVRFTESGLRLLISTVEAPPAPPAAEHDAAIPGQQAIVSGEENITFQSNRDAEVIINHAPSNAAVRSGALIIGGTVLLGATIIGATLMFSPGRHEIPRAPRAFGAPAAVPGADGVPPLQWAVTMADSDLDNCHAWTFPPPVSALPYHEFADDMAENDAWALSHGGIEKDRAVYTIVVQGTDDRPVVIRDLRLKILSTSAPRQGFTLHRALGCGGQPNERHYEGDLGGTDPRIRLIDPDRPDSATAAPAGTYTVSRNEPEVFAVYVFDSAPQPALYSYEFQLEWSRGGVADTVHISSANNRPFQLNATDRSESDPGYYPADGAWQEIR